jgi:hypothetical protein
MRVLALHKWPFDPAKVDKEMARYDFPETMRGQVTEAHQAAFVLVVESDGSPINLDEVSYAPTQAEVQEPQSRQVPWLEEVVDATRMAFFLHHLTPDGRLFIADAEVRMPPLTDLPSELHQILSYESP